MSIGKKREFSDRLYGTRAVAARALSQTRSVRAKALFRVGEAFYRFSKSDVDSFSRVMAESFFVGACACARQHKL